MDRLRQHPLLHLLSLFLLAVFLTSPLSAQTDNTDTTDTVDNTDTGTDATVDTAIIGGPIPAAGVAIDAQGVLSLKRSVDGSGELSRQRRLQAVAALGRELSKQSDLRKVSLNRLEKAFAAKLAAGEKPGDDMLYLAGLTQLQYVFFYPESGDIVLAGPAEGFAINGMGHPIGIASGKTVLQLEDLIVALRTFGPGMKQAGVVSVSIDPTQEGLAKMQQFLAQMGGNAVPADTALIVKGLQDSLGLQTVTVNGISPRTHFASVLVEADYRMKLIGIGLEDAPANIPSYVSRAKASAINRNAMQRWFFVPDYDSVRVSDDGNAAELVGEGVKLVGANEMVREDGTRSQSKKIDKASEDFTEAFTREYGQLANKVPVYAQMRNIIDMLVAAAYIQEQDFYTQASWSMDTFGNEKKVPVEIYNAPRQVETAVNALWKGNVLMTPIGGGVHINARKAISSEHLMHDENGKVASEHEKVKVQQLAEGQWWWD